MIIKLPIIILMIINLLIINYDQPIKNTSYNY